MEYSENITNEEVKEVLEKVKEALEKENELKKELNDEVNKSLNTEVRLQYKEYFKTQNKMLIANEINDKIDLFFEDQLIGIVKLYLEYAEKPELKFALKSKNSNTKSSTEIVKYPEYSAVEHLQYLFDDTLIPIQFNCIFDGVNSQQLLIKRAQYDLEYKSKILSVCKNTLTGLINSLNCISTFLRTNSENMICTQNTILKREEIIKLLTDCENNFIETSSGLNCAVRLFSSNENANLSSPSSKTKIISDYLEQVTKEFDNYLVTLKNEGLDNEQLLEKLTVYAEDEYNSNVKVENIEKSIDELSAVFVNTQKQIIKEISDKLNDLTNSTINELNELKNCSESRINDVYAVSTKPQQFYNR